MIWKKSKNNTDAELRNVASLRTQDDKPIKLEVVIDIID